MLVLISYKCWNFKNHFLGPEDPGNLQVLESTLKKMKIDRKQDLSLYCLCYYLHVSF